MSTSTDGASPSVPPGPGAGSGTDPSEADDPDDPRHLGPPWLRQEIQRRMTANGSGSGGRHARRDGVVGSGVDGYVPRHAVHPAAPRPAPARPDPAPARPDSAPSGAPAPSPTPPSPVPRTADAPAPSSPSPGPTAAAPRPNRPASAAAFVAPGRAPWFARPAVPAPARPRPAATRAPTPRSPLVEVPEPRRPETAPGADPAARPGEARRVRVVLSERSRVARPVRTVEVVQEGTSVGELLRSNLIGSQLTVALRFALFTALTIGLLPLLFALFPIIGRTEVLGLRLPWLLLGVLVYPFLVVVGWLHTRAAERVEHNFADHVQD